VVPLTSTIRTFHFEVVIEPDVTNGLSGTSAAQCQHPRAASPQGIVATRDNVGPLDLSQIRETLAIILDIG
jgi:mRNA interferase MazF